MRDTYSRPKMEPNSAQLKFQLDAALAELARSNDRLYLTQTIVVRHAEKIEALTTELKRVNAINSCIQLAYVGKGKIGSKA